MLRVPVEASVAETLSRSARPCRSRDNDVARTVVQQSRGIAKFGAQPVGDFSKRLRLDLDDVARVSRNCSNGGKRIEAASGVAGHRQSSLTGGAGSSVDTGGSFLPERHFWNKSSALPPEIVGDSAAGRLAMRSTLIEAADARLACITAPRRLRKRLVKLVGEPDRQRAEIHGPSRLTRLLRVSITPLARCPQPMNKLEWPTHGD